MKNFTKFTVAIAIAVIFSLSMSSCSSKSIVPYIENGGIETLAQLAHPTSTIRDYTYKISGNQVFVIINYTNGYVTKLDVTHDNSTFTNIDVVSDSDWLYPFLATEIIKNAVILTLNEKDKEEVKGIIASFENAYQKRILELSGIELTLFIMTVQLDSYEA